MSRISVTVKHTLGIEKAKSRLSTPGIGEPAISVEKQEWIDNHLFFTAKAKGVPVTGTLVVNEDNVLCDVDVPWYAMAMAGQAKQELQDKLEEVLADC